MKRAISKFLFKLFGWDIEDQAPKIAFKAVLVHAPHTSNWDFIIGRMASWVYRLPVKFLIKKELFFFPLGWILKSMGGIPVDRSKNNNLTDQIAKLFSENDELAIIFTPEGTRKYNPKWKKGFYYLAIKSDVPIVLTFIDYKNKRGGFGPTFTPTGDVNKDIETIKDFYRDIQGKVPENGVR